MRIQEWGNLIAPNVWRKNFNGMPVLTVPLLLYCDDTSGSKSKKWTPFNVWAMMLAGMKREDNAKLQNIHFIVASNKVTPLEMAKPIVDDLMELERGVVMFDSFTQQDVVVVAPVLCVLADNPRAAELTNHMGSTANKFCRICHVIKNNSCNNSYM